MNESINPGQELSWGQRILRVGAVAGFAVGAVAGNVLPADAEIRSLDISSACGAQPEDPNTVTLTQLATDGSGTSFTAIAQPGDVVLDDGILFSTIDLAVEPAFDEVEVFAGNEMEVEDLRRCKEAPAPTTSTSEAPEPTTSTSEVPESPTSTLVPATSTTLGRSTTTVTSLPPAIPGLTVPTSSTTTPPAIADRAPAPRKGGIANPTATTSPNSNKGGSTVRTLPHTT